MWPRIALQRTTLVSPPPGMISSKQASMMSRMDKHCKASHRVASGAGSAPVTLPVRTDKWAPMVRKCGRKAERRGPSSQSPNVGPAPTAQLPPRQHVPCTPNLVGVPRGGHVVHQRRGRGLLPWYLRAGRAQWERNVYTHTRSWPRVESCLPTRRSEGRGFLAYRGEYSHGPPFCLGGVRYGRATTRRANPWGAGAARSYGAGAGVGANHVGRV